MTDSRRIENGGPELTIVHHRRDTCATEALLMFSSRLESTAQQFSQSEYQSIRNKSQGMKSLAREVRQEIDIRISI